MVPNIARGTSFKGVTDYLMHDKREGAVDKGATADRVGFTALLNFIGDEARNPFEASKIMALTVRDADHLKAAAGIKAGGRKAEKGPVWHTSLSWHPTEQAGQPEMMRAVEACLSAVGLGLDKGYHTYVVQHTDEPQAHVHVVVNLVHPINGKQANPYRDQPKAQAWGQKYEEERGPVFCKARDEKYGHKTPEQKAFNAAARDRTPEGHARPEAKPEAKADPFGRSRDRKPRAPRAPKTSRPEWQARKAQQEEDKQAEAAKLRAFINGRFVELEAQTAQAGINRKADADRFYADRKDARSAIYEKYASALDAVWNQIPDPRELGPDREPWLRFKKTLDARRHVFEHREKTLFGRMTNAKYLLKGKGGLFRIARLALSGNERKRMFERQSRTFFTQNAPPRPKTQARPKPQESKRAKSERIKTMRAAELSAHDRATADLGRSMKERHARDIDQDKSLRRDLSKMATEAWEKFGQTYGYDRDGVKQPGNAQNRSVDASDEFGRATNPEATQDASAREETASSGKRNWTAEEVAMFKKAKAEAKREEGRNQDDLGRTR